MVASSIAGMSRPLPRSPLEEKGAPLPAKRNLAKANMDSDHQDPPAKAGGNLTGGNLAGGNLVASSIATGFS